MSTPSVGGAGPRRAGSRGGRERASRAAAGHLVTGIRGPARRAVRERGGPAAGEGRASRSSTCTCAAHASNSGRACSIASSTVPSAGSRSSAGSPPRRAPWCAGSAGRRTSRRTRPPPTCRGRPPVDPEQLEHGGSVVRDGGVRRVGASQRPSRAGEPRRTPTSRAASPPDRAAHRVSGGRGRRAPPARRPPSHSWTGRPSGRVSDSTGQPRPSPGPAGGCRVSDSPQGPARPARPHHKLTDDGRRMREVLTYSRRGSRFTPRQAEGWAAHQADWVIPDEAVDRPDFDLLSWWPDRDAPLVVEVGSGVGEATAVLAAQRPDVNVLAFEVWTPGHRRRPVARRRGRRRQRPLLRGGRRLVAGAPARHPAASASCGPSSPTRGTRRSTASAVSSPGPTRR